MCFVGRVESEKGVDLIFEAFNKLSVIEKDRIEMVHFVGEIKDLKFLSNLNSSSDLPVKYHGVLGRTDVFNIFRKSHLLLLPSQSEGFPKVVAEAMAFGCIPIVSDVSSIGQYIEHKKQGFLINPLNAMGLREQILRVFNLKNEDYLKIIENQKNILSKFTYSYYNYRIATEILERA